MDNRYCIARCNVACRGFGNWFEFVVLSLVSAITTLELLEKYHDWLQE